jgi:hypothetical protein
VLCGVLYILFFDVEADDTYPLIFFSDVEADDTYYPLIYRTVSESEKFFLHECENVVEESGGHMLSTTDFQRNVNSFENKHGGENSYNSTLVNVMRKLNLQKSYVGNSGHSRYSIYSENFPNDIQLTTCERLCLHIQLIKTHRPLYDLYSYQSDSTREIRYIRLADSNKVRSRNQPISPTIAIHMLNSNP